MPPRFSKKGQLNADEVHLPMLLNITTTVCHFKTILPDDYKKTRY